jgi:hypothetical protein
MPTSPSLTETEWPKWKVVLRAELRALIREAQRIQDLWADQVEAAWKAK